MSGALSREDALKVWPLVEPMVKRVTDRDRGRSSPETLRKLIEEEKAVLWAHDGLDLVWITSIEKHLTGKKSCLVIACAGEGLDTCKEEIERVAEYAKFMGCDQLQIYGREGWLKALDGFEKDITILTREL